MNRARSVANGQGIKVQSIFKPKFLLTLKKLVSSAYLVSGANSCTSSRSKCFVRLTFVVDYINFPGLKNYF